MGNAKIISKEIRRIYTRFIYALSSAVLSPRRKNVNPRTFTMLAAAGARITRGAASTDLVEEIRAALGRYTGSLKEDPH